MSLDWNEVSRNLTDIAHHAPEMLLTTGQREVCAWLAGRIGTHGTLIADEVGLGKTRIACALIDAVTRAGGRVAVIAPPRLVFQWQAEWRQYLEGCIAEQRPHAQPQMLRSRWALLDTDRHFPCAASDRWLLLSSHFAAFRIRKDDDDFITLLTLVAEAIRQRTGNIVVSGAYTFAKAIDSTQSERYQRVIKFLTGRQERRADLTASLAADRYLAGLDGVKEKFALNTSGREIMHRAVGYMLGKVDLVIIDEAHKSRGDAEKNNDTALGRLLENILIQAPDARRVALTATPVELGADQWKATLQRVGVTHIEQDVFKKFSDAIHEIRKSPTDMKAARDLVDAATAFRRTLAPFVVRRLRVKDVNFRRLIPAAELQQARAHPHRLPVLITKILIDALSPPWRRNVFAFESLGKAAKGLPEAHIEKMIDRRFSSGHIDDAMLEKLTTHVAEDADPLLARKRARASFWARHVVGSELDKRPIWLASHPRIREAIRRIELWTTFAGPDDIREKVLVFGTYTEPLRTLRDCLNARSLLRQIALPAPARRGTLPMDLIAYEMEQMQQAGIAPPALQNIDAEGLQSLLTDAARDWERLRQNIASTISDEWTSTEMKVSTQDGKDISILAEYLRERIIFDALSQGRNPATTPEERRERARIVLNELKGALVAEGEDQEAEDNPLVSQDELQRIARHIIDDKGGNELHASHGSSMPAIYLGGGVNAVSQRLIQARFNDENANPNVLICQSQVGREGLNLHKACRVVLLFHPEWNPGVVEQQIGRIDRIGSRWEKLARRFAEQSCATAEFPRIVIEALCFDGTYDAYQTDQLNRRMIELKAQLFGEFLNDLDASEEVRAVLQGQGVDFSPPVLR